MMLMHIDQARQHEAAAGIDDLIESVGRRHLRSRADRDNVGTVDRDKAIRENISRRIDTNDVPIRDQCSCHARLAVATAFVGAAIR